MSCSGANKSLKFQTSVDSDDGQGSKTKVWSDIGTLSGYLSDVRYSKKFFADRNTSNYTHMFLVHTPGAFTITRTGRFINIDETKIYKIVGIGNPGSNSGIFSDIMLAEKIL